MRRIRDDVVVIGHLLEPIIEAPDHDRAHGPHPGYVLAGLASPLDPSSHGFGHRHRLWNAKADRGVDTDAAEGSLFNGRHAGLGNRNLDDHIGSQAVEVNRLLDYQIGIPVVLRIGLNGKPAIFSFFPLEDGEQQLGALDRHLFGEFPRDLVFRCPRSFLDELSDPGRPQVHLLVEHFTDNRRIGRRPDGAILDGVSQLGDGAGVVPEIGVGGGGHFM